MEQINRSNRPSSGHRLPHHISGLLHVTGQSRFVTDEPRPENLLFAQPVPSAHARAKIVGIDASRALSFPGVAGVYTWRDIPGQNQIGHLALDEPLLPQDEVTYVGQPVALVVAASEEAARQAAALVDIQYRELRPVLTVDEALEQNLLYAPERRIERGDVETGFKQADHVIEGTVCSGGQEHLYLETQACRAVPGEDEEVVLYSATQSTAEVQEVAARVLGVRSKDVTVDVRRLGGAFGGKERAATLWACLAALACRLTRRPVELRLARHEDAAWTGKRHPYQSRYRTGFTRDGRIVAHSVELNSNGGAYTDLSMAILERSMLHSDNAYYLPNVRIVARACRTNLPPNTAFRGFGAPQGIFVIETVMERIARTLRMDPVAVRSANSYREGQTTPFGQPVLEACQPELFERLLKNAGYDALRAEVREFNSSERDRRRGIGVVPVKFGISFTSALLNQGSALLWVYADGSISLSHGGIEMGQEVNTKVAQVVARELGVTIGRVRVESSNTKRTGNASPTAASTGSDINGNAARHAARQIKARLVPFAGDLLKDRTGLEFDMDSVAFEDDAVYDRRRPEVRLPFGELAHKAWAARIDLGAHGFYATPVVQFDRERGQGSPFHYFVSGCCLALAEADLVSGNCRLLRVHIVHETGESLNPAIDRGQIEGGFVQGFGWCTFEELPCDQRGRCLAASTSTYKIPTIRDLPEIFDVEMVDRPRQCASVFGSKAVGEPPFVYGLAAYFAIKDAIESLADHQRECGLPHPATPEAVLMAVERLRNP